MTAPVPKPLKSERTRLALLTTYLESLPLQAHLSKTLATVCSTLAKIDSVHTATYILWQGTTKDHANMLFINGTSTFSQDDLTQITQHIQHFIQNSSPQAIENKESWESQLNQRLSYEVQSGTMVDSSVEQVKDKSHFCVPISHQKKTLAILHIASAQDNPGFREQVNELINLAMKIYSYVNTRTQAEKERMTSTLKSMSNGVILVDITKRVTLMNPMAEKIITTTPFMSTQLATLFQGFEESTQRELLFAVDQAMTRGHTTHLPEVNYQDRVYEVSISPVNDHVGTTTGGALVWHDITHHIEVQRTKAEFLVLAAHQLRTPLSNMRWQLETLIEQEGLPEQTVQQLRDVHTVNTTLTTIVGELLEVARLEQGVIQTPSQAIDIATLVALVVEELKPLALERSVTTTVGISDSTPHVSLPPSWGKRVLHEILENAIIYNNAGGTVSVTAEQKNSMIHISIQDTGIGIPPTEHKNVLASFARASNALKKETDRSGLGLYVANLFVKRWGGTLTFKSTEGKGSTFIVSVPLANT